jgi:hypothetical protein
MAYIQGATKHSDISSLLAELVRRYLCSNKHSLTFLISSVKTYTKFEI